MLNMTTSRQNIIQGQCSLARLSFCSYHVLKRDDTLGDTRLDLLLQVALLRLNQLQPPNSGAVPLAQLLAADCSTRGQNYQKEDRELSAAIAFRDDKKAGKFNQKQVVTFVFDTPHIIIFCTWVYQKKCPHRGISTIWCECCSHDINI